MRVLIIDATGNALDFAMRAEKSGHDVRLFVRQTEKTKHIGRGLVTLVDDYKPHLRWADLIFLPDNTFYLHDLDSFRRSESVGKTKIVGPTVATAEWELDRSKGMQILRDHGVRVASSREFTDYDQAIAYVKKEGRRFVSKPSGDEPDKALSYVSKSPDVMFYMLMRCKNLGRLSTPVLL